MAFFKSIYDCSTLSDFEEYEDSLKISHSGMHYQSAVVNQTNNKRVIFNHTSIVNKYFYQIMEHTRKITLTNEELMQYMYQPKKYCFDKYGTTELWSMLLKINYMGSCIEFNNKNIRVFTSDIFTVLNEILILEKEELEKNEVSVYGEGVLVP